MSSRIALLLALALLASTAAPAACADFSADSQVGAVPSDVLAGLGLGGLKPVSDSAGKLVRGKLVVYGTPGSGFFVTDVGSQALLSAQAGNSTPGQTLHDLVNHATTINYNPNFGSKTVPGH